MQSSAKLFVPIVLLATAIGATATLSFHLRPSPQIIACAPERVLVGHGSAARAAVYSGAEAATLDSSWTSGLSLTTDGQ